MRNSAVVSAFFLVVSACAASQGGGDGLGGDGGNGGGGGGSADAGPGLADAGGGGGTPDAGGGMCVDACDVEFKYPAAGVTSVELRGSFAADGWENGVALSQNGDWFEASVNVTDGARVQYKFIVDGEWVADPNNPNQVADGFGGFNSVLDVRCDECGGSASFDWRDAIMYFVMVDRFHDGDSTNNQPLSSVEPAANFSGGDLKGVLQKIEDGYFTDLGVNVLWLTAPFDNTDAAGVGDDGHNYSAYHGYWPSKLDAIESKIGTLDDMRAIVQAAHDRDIKIVLDYVMNHVHIDSPTYAAHPEWFWSLNKDGKTCVCGGGCEWGGDEGRRCWFRDYLPDFNFTNADARAFSVNNAIQWAQDLGIDGYRLDAVKHIETQWLRDLRSRLSSEVVSGDQVFYLVGETFDGSRDLIKSYVDPNTMLDGQFDFPLRANMAKTILARQGSMGDLAGFLDSNDGFYGPGSVMGTFIGNHDLPRSIHIAEDAPMFGEWDSGKSRSWNSLPGLPDYSAPFERIAVAYAMLMTIQGVPLIYYGDEFGMAGGGDPDNRRPMQWTNHTADQTWLRDYLAKLTKIRGQYPSLRRGTRSTLGSGWDTMVYRMSGGGDDVIVALNRGDSAANADGLPAGTYTNLIDGATVTAPLSLPARTAMILVAQ